MNKILPYTPHTTFYEKIHIIILSHYTVSYYVYFTVRAELILNLSFFFHSVFLYISLTEPLAWL